MRVLLVTANFAPRSASPAVRTVHIAKYLEKLGHDVSVLTYDDATLTLFSPPDHGLSLKVPPSVKVTRIGPGFLRRRLVAKKKLHQPEVIRGYKESARKSILSALLIPDPHVDSVYGFVRAASRIIREFRPDTVITFGYPFSMHVVGYLLKRRYPGVSWAADYGDPWTGTPISELPRPAWRRTLDYRLERILLRRADAVFVTTNPTKTLYTKLFPAVADKLHVVPMGYDPDDFSTISPVSRDHDRRLWLVHTGRLYDEARDPKPFVEALSSLKNEIPDLKERLRVYLVGDVAAPIRALIETSPAGELFQFVSWVPLQESIAWMKAADYLLLFGNRGDIQVPGKVYQYMGSGRPVFMTCCSEKDPTASIVSMSVGSLVVTNSATALRNTLLSMLEGKGSDTPASVAGYSWANIVENFMHIFKEPGRRA